MTFAWKCGRQGSGESWHRRRSYGNYDQGLISRTERNITGGCWRWNSIWWWAFSSRGFRSKLDDGRSLPHAHSLRNKSRGNEAVFLTFPPWSWCFREQRIHLLELNLAFIFSICSSSLQHSITVNVVYFESISPLTWLSVETCKEVRSLTLLWSRKRSSQELLLIWLESFQAGCY